MKKVISISLAICMLNLSIGCSSTKTLSINEVKLYSSSATDYLILHTAKKIYQLHDYKFGNQFLEGNLKKFKLKNGYFVHVYTKLDININLENNTTEPLQLELKNIHKIEQRKTNIAMDILKAAGITIGTVPLIGIIALLTGSLDIGYYGW